MVSADRERRAVEVRRLFFVYGGEDVWRSLLVTFVTPQNPKTSHARVRSNFARVVECACGVVVLWGSGE